MTHARLQGVLGCQGAAGQMQRSLLVPELKRRQALVKLTCQMAVRVGRPSREALAGAVNARLESITTIRSLQTLTGCYEVFHVEQEPRRGPRRLAGANVPIGWLASR